MMTSHLDGAVCAADGCDNPPESPRHLYCSKYCQYKTWKKRKQADPEKWRRYLDGNNAARHGRLSVLNVCDWCGTEFRATKKARYCSMPCQAEAKRWRLIQKDRCDVPWGSCPTCGQRFVAHGRVHCSVRCRALARVEGSGAVPASGLTLVAGFCKRCGLPFVSKRPRARYCSPECRELWTQRERPEVKALRSEAKRRRRARVRGVEVEKFSADDIFERDGWRCQLCGKKVERGLAPSDLMAATIDHIVPIVDGGAHTRSNVQLAHRLCNSLKGAGRVPKGEQLRLVG